MSRWVGLHHQGFLPRKEANVQPLTPEQHVLGPQGDSVHKRWLC